MLGQRRLPSPSEFAFPRTGIPIKQLTMVEDRMDYYKNRNVAAQNALVQALQTLALVNGASANGTATPPASGPAPALDLNNLAALLALDSAGVRAPAPYAPSANGYSQQAAAAAAAAAASGRLSAASPFPGMLSPADLAAATASLRLGAGPAFGAYAPPPVPAPSAQGLTCGSDGGAGWAPVPSSGPGSDGSFSLASASLARSTDTALSSLGSPGNGSPPASLAGSMVLPLGPPPPGSYAAQAASLRTADAQTMEAASWGLTGGAFST